ncbi:hypothetical protein AN639_05630 [Candidatus Epulonipiscium fishelsonii]|uniref:Uncharacterized protein n=1 Tax=Candidatus Epulonipiscium fishelsonii TaxID=77094 RepID=A0ACC8X920_9FIRM|nr:hypothetical protein AN396_10665 [Epulopiscium sp. SCG-B11WGA-EpuloA1]ONI39929.1 hypothetical protein AN639_05630 [Epulopiscium sp. SCG-B05WGA-EpuloA1]
MDEIIVVDTGSTDKTVEIAKDLGAKVYDFKWVDDFSKARNFAISKATGDWIIFPDADEYFEEGKQQNLLKRIKLVDGLGYEALQLYVRQINKATPKKWTFSYYIKAFKNKSCLRYERAIHELLVNTEQELYDVQLEEADIILYHDGYSNPEIQNDKLDRNINLLLKVIEDNPADKLSLLYLAREFLSKKDYESTYKYLMLIEGDLGIYETYNRKVAYYTYLLSTLNSLNKPLDMLQQVYNEAIDFDDNYSNFNFIMALYYIKNREHTKSIKYLEKTIDNLQIIPNHKYLLVNIFDIDKVYELLAQSYRLQGNLKKSREICVEKLGHKTVSLCIIAKNEEHNLFNCITSVKNIVDEIIVVDTGSTDKTVEIAKSLGATVHYFEWVNDFSKARNFTISKATGDWILFIDADEYLNQKHQTDLFNSIQQVADTGINAISICRINYNLKGGLTKQDYKIKAFKNCSEISYTRPIHEFIVHNNDNLNVMTLPSDKVRLYHNGYSEEELVKKDTINRNLQILLANIASNPDDEIAFLYLGRELVGKQDFENAYKYLKCIKDICKVELKNKEKMYYVNFLNCMMELKVAEDEIVFLYNQAINFEPDFPDFHWNMALYYLAKNNILDAIDCFEKTAIGLKRFPQDNFGYVNIKMLSEIYMMIIDLYMLINEYDKVIFLYKELLSYNKADKNILNRFLDLVKDNYPEDIVEFLKEIYDFKNYNELDFIDRVMKERKMSK